MFAFHRFPSSIPTSGKDPVRAFATLHAHSLDGSQARAPFLAAAALMSTFNSLEVARLVVDTSANLASAFSSRERPSVNTVFDRFEHGPFEVHRISSGGLRSVLERSIRGLLRSSEHPSLPFSSWEICSKCSFSRSDSNPSKPSNPPLQIVSMVLIDIQGGDLDTFGEDVEMAAEARGPTAAATW